MRTLLTVAAVALLIASAFAQAPSAPTAPAAALAPGALFTIAGNTAVLENAPVMLTKEGPFGPRMQFINGGVRSLANNGAHAATNATSQMLVVLRDNPKVRYLFTLADGLYRIVAKRSAGITKLADLKGKRVVVPRGTSAHYFLVAMLRTAGLQESDVTLVTAPATGMAAAVLRGDADAISMWEPESQNAVVALGRDAVIFQDNTVYREFFSVYSTTDVLNDPKRRAELVEFVRALKTSTDRVKDVRPHLALISGITKHPADQIERSWEHHAWPFAIPNDLLDKMVDEDTWVAATQQRMPRSRQELAGYIDASVLRDALAR